MYSQFKGKFPGYRPPYMYLHGRQIASCSGGDVHSISHDTENLKMQDSV